jgi:VanZ family protein
MVAIFAASAQHDVTLPSHTTDKQVHAAAYMGLSITATRAFAGGLARGATPAAAVAGWALSAAYGATDEWHQAFVAGRSSDRADWYADVIGSALGAAGCWAWGIIRARSDAF